MPEKILLLNSLDRLSLMPSKRGKGVLLPAVIKPPEGHTSPDLVPLLGGGHQGEVPRGLAGLDHIVVGPLLDLQP
jgi:hypothetical protein